MSDYHPPASLLVSTVGETLADDSSEVLQLENGRIKTGS